MLPPRQELKATVFYMMSWNFNGLRNMEHMGCPKEAQPLGGTELIHTLGGTDQTQTLDGAPFLKKECKIHQLQIMLNVATGIRDIFTLTLKRKFYVCC